MLVGRERIELPETYVAGFTDRPAAFYGISAHVVPGRLTGHWSFRRDSNPHQLLTRQPHYRCATEAWCLIRDSNPEETGFESVTSTNCINQTSGTPTANRTLIHGLEDRCTLRCAIGAFGVRGGSRTRKTCILSAVPVPIRLHGQIGLPSGLRTRSPRFLRAVRIPIPTPGEMVSLPGFEPGVRRL